MRIANTIVAAFVGDGLDGNLAAVCPLRAWLPDQAMQAIAAFNGLPETAFVKMHPERCRIRWFTPTQEVPLCGHATLAAVFVLHHRLGWREDPFRFETAFGDGLQARIVGEFIALDFPAAEITPSNDPAPARALGLTPREILLGESWVCVLETADDVRAFEPDFDAIAALPEDGIIITAPGEDCDFVSRYFVPQAGIPEDPVTGYAHTLLVPYWSRRLGRTELHARQLSRAGGELFCRLEGGRVIMHGRGRLINEGELVIEDNHITAATA